MTNETPGEAAVREKARKAIDDTLRRKHEIVAPGLDNDILDSLAASGIVLADRAVSEDQRTAIGEALIWIVRAISEEWYSASWSHGIEHELYDLTDGILAQTLHTLSQMIDGWPCWVEGAPEIVPRTMWRDTHAEWQQESRWRRDHIQ